MNRVYNWVLHAIHIAIIIFSMIGWLFVATRLYHLVLCSLIIFSWFGVGIVAKKPGMCLVTELQKRVWKSMGIEDRDGYIIYLVERVTGKTPSSKKVDIVTQIFFFSTFILSICLFVRQI
ncbi:DUF2784 family protein [Endozoicomonas sp. SM1973]|uniref:DUF2784 family protein n=1 Tax=Spartinivicinus marinus TaxID=2994442 RepID=A0A853IF95_9GAMM|nr:DUF2784 family protein [Spartinivicinus marinus]MCX4026182.1 DUF2784 family protein [Spartinivicinus marinus]NYZ68714.1 DUF2784 family protein [Spartinivicinus marinus]